MVYFLCFIFFLSGTAALIFEFLWFRLIGLMLGNSVWSTTIVLSSFMGGLALGNFLLARWGDRIKQPVRFYAFLEILVAALGGALVLLLPHLTKLLVPFLQPFLLDQPFLLNALRTITALILMLIPAIAMGATLPVLVKALNKKAENFGNTLGVLYGSNTLGAVLGVISADLFLIKWFGLTLTGYIAMALNLLAATGAFVLSTKLDRPKSFFFNENTTVGSTSPAMARNILTVSFFTGFVFLALEVIWFRFMMLFFNAYSTNFSVMLATILAGIGLGGMSAARWYKKRGDSKNLIIALLLINAILVIFNYHFFYVVLQCMAHLVNKREVIGIFLCSLFLIFPIAFVSGAIFTALGKMLHETINHGTKSAGLLTFTNTLGGMLGSFAGGFILIPLAGVERSFFLIAVIYGALVFFLANIRVLISIPPKFIYYPLYAILLYMIAFFPFGLIYRFLDIPLAPFKIKGEYRVAYKEGLNETIQYLQKSLLARPLYQRLMTNGHSMSGTSFGSKRYMKMFVYLPVALHPYPKKAALICFGCGITAKALTDTKGLQSIEIVDTSKDIIEMSRVVYPDPKTNPIYDARVNIHIEDGRFFLLTTKDKFDLITAEPPPPKYRGVVNLYSQEYFELIYDRLNDGGITTYWLPVYMLHPSETKAILKAFCNAFPRCSLWSGNQYDWMMVGIKGSLRPVDEKMFTRQWADPVVAPEMKRLGLNSPEKLGSLFIADEKRIRDWTKNTSALSDQFPKRLEDTLDYFSFDSNKNYYKTLLEPNKIIEAFQNNNDILQIWPQSIRKKTLEHLPIAQTALLSPASHPFLSVRILHGYLNNPLITDFEINWLMDSDPYAQNIITEMLEQTGHSTESFFELAQLQINDVLINNRKELAVEWLEICKHSSVHAFLQRNFSLAEKYYQPLSYLADESNKKYFFYLRAYFLAQAGSKDKAKNVLEEYKKTVTGAEDNDLVQYQAWLADNIPSAKVPAK